MKRYVLLVGGTGARLADALLVAASAGAFPKEELHVLLADTDRRGVRSAGLVAAKMADYARVHQAMQGAEGPLPHGDGLFVMAGKPAGGCIHPGAVHRRFGNGCAALPGAL